MRKCLFAFLLVTVISLVVVPDEILDVYFIDVGHGDAILIKFGTQEWLIDTGYKNAWTSSFICSELLNVKIDLPVEYFILSHEDLDHYSALDLFFCPCQIEQLFSSYDPGAMALLEDEIRQSVDCDFARQEDVATHPLTSDSPSVFAESGLDWAVLHPSADFAKTCAGDNENSLVLLLTFGSVSFLLTGDIESIPDEAAESWNISSDILILKAPHHGRANSATLALVEWLTPNLIVVSTGDSIPETAVAITQLGIPLFSTSTSGTIHISTDGESVWVSTDALSRQIADCSEE